MLAPWLLFFFFFFKQKTAYESPKSDWSSDVCSSDLGAGAAHSPGWCQGRYRNPGGGLNSNPSMTADAPAAEPATKPVARAASGRDYLLLLLLSALWGWSFPLIKIGVATLPPLWVASGRIALGAIALLTYMTIRGTRLPRGRPVWLRLGYMGIVGNILPFALISWGEVHVASGIAAILMAMVPMMVVVVAHFRLPDEPLTFGKTLGVILGIIGTIVLIGPSALTGLGSSFAGEVAILIATVCYASSALAGRGVPPMPAESASGAMLLVAAPLGLVAAAIIDPPWTIVPSAGSLAAVATLGVLCTGLG